MQASSSSFRHVLSPSRTGQALESLDAFEAASSTSTTTKVKEYSIVVVTDSRRQRILLGLKHRGFGKGLYNSFGGKKEEGETVEECACRELQEEAGIVVPLSAMKECCVGTMNYTFEDQKGFLMKAHVFQVDICDSSADSATPKTGSTIPIDPSCLRGCDEITPKWFDSYWEIPLDNMFADDSLWLTQLLMEFSKGNRLLIDGWFHFLEGGQEVNSIRHYYMDIRPKNPPFSLEKRLFHSLCCNKLHNTSIKEFKEAWAFTNAVESIFKKQPIQVIIDVAGGHGALAALLLITLPSTTRAVVIDPAQVGKGAVEKAWRQDFLKTKPLDYRHEDLRTGLPAELALALQTVEQPSSILVVACHACQHLSEEILEIVCTQFPGVHAAVMPCCQRDSSRGNSWKHTSKNLQVPIEKVMDLLLAGKVMSWRRGYKYEYDVRMKVMDPQITPQNRIILCKATLRNDGTSSSVDAAHQKLAATYAKAHGVSSKKTDRRNQLSPLQMGFLCGIVGFAAGLWVAGRGKPSTTYSS